VLTILAFATYAAISAACLLITFLEGWTEHDRYTPLRLAGLAACVLWPLILLLPVIHAALGPRFVCAPVPKRLEARRRLT
jgi:hypothetical protein